jgi:hypothetical protein
MYTELRWKKSIEIVEIDIVTAVVMKSSIFWDMKPCEIVLILAPLRAP